MKALMGALRSTTSFVGSCIGAAGNFAARVVGAPLVLMGMAGRYAAQLISIAAGSSKPALDAGEDDAPRFEGLPQDMELEDFMEKVYGNIRKWTPQQAQEVEAAAVMRYAHATPQVRKDMINRFDPELKNWLEPMQVRELVKLSKSTPEQVTLHLSGQKSIPNVMPIVREKRIIDLVGTPEDPAVKHAKALREERQATKVARVEARKTGQAAGIAAAPGEVIDIMPELDGNARRMQAVERVKQRMADRMPSASGPAAAYRPSAQMQMRFAGGMSR